MSDILPALVLLLDLADPSGGVQIAKQTLDTHLLSRSNLVQELPHGDIYQYVDPNSGKSILVTDVDRDGKYSNGVDRIIEFKNNRFYRKVE